MGKFDVVGTPLKCTWGGIDFRVRADASITELLREKSSTRVPTSGMSMRQDTRIIQSLTGFPFVMNQVERQQFDTLADSGEHNFDFVDAAGFTITGRASAGGDSSRTSDEGTYTADMEFETKPTIINPT